MGGRRCRCRNRTGVGNRAGISAAGILGCAFVGRVCEGLVEGSAVEEEEGGLGAVFRGWTFSTSFPWVGWIS